MTTTTDQRPEPTIVACATTRGGEVAVLRLSGPAAWRIAAAAGLPATSPWRLASATWPVIAGGSCPVRLLRCPGPRSFTGLDLIEITLPGSPDLVDLALQRLVAAGAEPAPPGGFVRQAIAHGRIALAEAESILAVVSASDADSAIAAARRLGGRLVDELAAARRELVEALAICEAGLDFADEAAISRDAATAVGARIRAVRDRLARWSVVADGGAEEPLVCLAGPANAGKSALYAALTGEPALVSAVPGTTRDALEAVWAAAGRRVRLVDTAGWLDARDALDAEAIAAGRRLVAGADLVLACSAPDALLPDDHGLPAGRTVVVATKGDLGPGDPRAGITVSAATGSGLAGLARLVADRVSGAAPGRQGRTLAGAVARLERSLRPQIDATMQVEDLRQTAAELADLLGETTTDEVLDQIFARFCVGK